MAKLQTLGKKIRSIKEPFDRISSKADNILEILDDTKYYVASINALGIPLVLYDKSIPSGTVSDEIEISKEKYSELKNRSFFYSEVPKEGKITGVEVIKTSANLTKHHKLENLLKQPPTEHEIIGPEPEPTKREVQKHETPKIRTECPLPSVRPQLNIKFDREPSEYQMNIFNYIDRLVKRDPSITQKNLLIEAGPGSGKTHSIEQATKIVTQYHRSCCFLAFNTHITDEFRPRAPAGVDVSTLNSAGNRSVWNYMKNRKIIKTLNKHNVTKIIDYLYTLSKYSSINQEEFKKLKGPAKKLVDLYKATLLDINNTTILDLIDRYNIDIDFDNQDFIPYLLSICKDVTFINYNVLTNKWENFDFNDQWWLPVVYRGETDQNGNILSKDIIPTKQYDFVFVDETQDLNKAQIKLCQLMCKPNGSIICVGDRNQAIYGFRGADVNSIPNIINELNPKIFTLPITYRCPKEHVRLVKEFARNLPDEDYTRDFKLSVEKLEYATLENSPYEAIDGEIVENCKSSKILHEAIPGDLIISRINAALIKPYLELLKNAITLPEKDRPRIVLLGKNFGEDLVELINKIIIQMNKEDRSYTIEDFISTLTSWKNNQVEKLTRKNLSIDKVVDMYETLIVFADEFEDIDTIRSTAETIFSDEDAERKKTGAKITLGTIHKAKGGEVDTKNNNLFIIKSFKGKPILPLSFPQSRDWEKTQENNLVYVAYTRGKNKMYLVDS